jgi:TPR repeat protein
MTTKEKQQAIKWYIKGIDLITIAQHYNLHVEELKKQIRKL